MMPKINTTSVIKIAKSYLRNYLKLDFALRIVPNGRCTDQVEENNYIKYLGVKSSMITFKYLIGRDKSLI